MNIFTATGRLGQDAEVRFTAVGTAVAGMSIAVDVGFGEKKTTLWLRGNLWGKRAEGGLVQYLTKGAQVAVSGELSNREWIDKDGNKKLSLELNIATIDLIGGKQGGGHQDREDHGGSQYGGEGQQAMGDDVPF